MNTEINSKIQAIRNLMRPYLTVWASLSYTLVAMMGMWSGKLDPKDCLIVTAGLLGTVLGYHFGKSVQIDGGGNGKGA